jgi:hypothetical protein
VLQFNRIDFRLPWFRHHFPRAKIIHLYRHPREQWCSSLMNPMACPRTVLMANFGPHDHFYLRSWARDLKYHFPFLEEGRIEHPYQMFYLVWKLSYLFGRFYSHCSLPFEEILKNPETSLGNLFGLLDIRCADMDRLLRLIEKPQIGKWKDYADETWFQDHEAVCEGVIAEFFQPPPTPPSKTKAPLGAEYGGAHRMEGTGDGCSWSKIISPSLS